MFFVARDFSVLSLCEAVPPPPPNLISFAVGKGTCKPVLGVHPN